MSAISLTRSITACAVLVVTAAIVAAVAFMPASARNGQIFTTIRPHPLATIIVTGDSTAIFAAVNTNGAGSGIIGQSGPSLFGPAAGAGVFGIFNQSSGVGEGILGFSQNGAGVVAENFGGSQAALYAQNFSAFAGPAMQGLSNGNALVATSNNTNSIVGITNAPGGGVNSAVLGEDNANDGLFNDGVFGTTTNDGYGVEGTATSGSLAAVGGIGTGTEGVVGVSDTLDGVAGHGNVSSVPAGIGLDVGVSGSSTNANGVYGFSTNRNGGAFENNTTSYYSLYAQSDITGGFIFGGSNTADFGSIQVDSHGNMIISGKITTGGSCSIGCARARVLSYAPSEAQPTMEDFGEGQLVNGQAYVSLDPAFANVIDQHTTYLVFITPEGDSNGVYVTQKSLTGFQVRENRGGHSTMPFSYRIVAKPYGVNAPRLAMVDQASLVRAASFGSSNPRMLPMLLAAHAHATVRHWSAYKQYVHDHGILMPPTQVRVPGPPPNVIHAANQLRSRPH